MLEIRGPLPADRVGVAVNCRLHIETWRRFTGSFSTNNPYLLKSERSAVFDGGDLSVYERYFVEDGAAEWIFFLIDNMASQYAHNYKTEFFFNNFDF